MSVGLSGNLLDFGIADVFQLIGQQRKTGVLELRNEEVRARLVFDRGLVVSAAPGRGRAADLDPVADRMVRCGVLTRERAEEAQAAYRSSAQTFNAILIERSWCPAKVVAQIEELVTRDTIFEVLRWRSGQFGFRAETVHHERNQSDLLGAEQILMDGLRMVDEWQSFCEVVPSDEVVFKRSGSFERFVETAGRMGDEDRERAERVYEFVDGRLSARRVIDLAQLGNFDGVRYLAELVKGGAVTAVHLDSVQRLQRFAHTAGRRTAGLRGLGTSVAPLLVLALAVAWTLSVAETPVVTPTNPVGVSGLTALQEAFAARAIRQAIEAHRVERGEWPSDLAELERQGLLPSGALATAPGRAYYSVHRDRGLVFLAPERSSRGTR